MNRSDFDAKRWKLGAWRWDDKARLWYLGGYYVLQDDAGAWCVDEPLGRQRVPPCATMEEAQAKCEREIIEGLLSAVEEV